MTEPAATQHFQCPAVVLTLTTPQILGDDLADSLREQLIATASGCGARNVVLDFSHVKYLSSAGFRPLLALHKQLRMKNGQLLFCQLTPEVREIFEVTRLIGTQGFTAAPFEVYPTAAAALESLGKREVA